MCHAGATYVRARLAAVHDDEAREHGTGGVTLRDRGDIGDWEYRNGDDGPHGDDGMDNTTDDVAAWWRCGVMVMDDG